MTLDQKIQAILEHNLKRWDLMERNQLINELWNEMHEYLDNEIDQGNELYIEELYEEIAE